MTKPRAARDAQKSDDWTTPPDLLASLDERYGPFNFDPCGAVGQDMSSLVLSRGGSICVAPDTNISTGIAAMYPDRILVDGLKHAWPGRFVMNPPFSLMAEFVEMAVLQVAGGSEIGVAILPVRTGRPWWQQYVMQAAARRRDGSATLDGLADEVIFLPGRLKYEGPCYYNPDRPYPMQGCDGTGIMAVVPSTLGATATCRRCRGTGKISNSATFDSCIVVWRDH